MVSGLMRTEMRMKWTHNSKSGRVHIHRVLGYERHLSKTVNCDQSMSNHLFALTSFILYANKSNNCHTAHTFGV